MRIRHVAAAAAAALAIVTTSCAQAVPTRGSTTRTVTPLPTACPTNGGPASAPTSITALGRSSILVAPTNYQPGVAYPLLVSLHPFLLGPEAWEAYSRLGERAAQRGYWVLIPQGSDPGPRWTVPGGLEIAGDDIGWIDALIQQTASTVCIDGQRVFAAGFSAGAAMAVGLSCELPGRFRAIAASGGSNLTSLCPNGAPVNATILHGTADPIAPIGGSEIPFAPPLGLSVETVVDSFVKRDACDSTPEVLQLSATVTVTRYSCGTRRVDYWREAGAGHTWAGTPSLLDIVTGVTDTSFSATNAVLDFFGTT